MKNKILVTLIICLFAPIQGFTDNSSVDDLIQRLGIRETAVAIPDSTTLGIIYGNLFVTFFAVFALRGIYYALLEETKTPKHLTGASVAVIAFVGYTPEIFFGPITGRILDANPGVQGHHNYFAFLAAISVAGILVTALLIWLKRNQRVRHAAISVPENS